MSEHNQLKNKDPLTEDASKPTQGRPVTWWWLVAALAGGIIIGIGGLYVFDLLARTLAILVLGISIANALAPVVNWLQKHGKMARGLAIFFTFLVLLIIFAGVLYLTIPLLVSQLKALGKQVNVWVPQVVNFFEQFGFDKNTLLSTFSGLTSQLGSMLISLPTAIAGALLDFVLTVFVSLYWLILMNGIRTYYLSFYPKDERNDVHKTLSAMGDAMGGYLRGSAIDGLIFGTAKFIGLMVIGVPFALTLGVIAAFLEFFPTIGAIVSAAIATLIALTVSPTTALITLGFTILLQQAENHILVPLVMRSQTSISPLLAVLAVVGGYTIGGILGAIVAIPIVAALEVLVNRMIGPALRRANGLEESEVEHLRLQELEHKEKVEEIEAG